MLSSLWEGLQPRRFCFCGRGGSCGAFALVGAPGAATLLFLWERRKSRRSCPCGMGRERPPPCSPLPPGEGSGERVRRSGSAAGRRTLIRRYAPPSPDGRRKSKSRSACLPEEQRNSRSTPTSNPPRLRKYRLAGFAERTEDRAAIGVGICEAQDRCALHDIDPCIRRRLHRSTRSIENRIYIAAVHSGSRAVRRSGGSRDRRVGMGLGWVGGYI
jgi:hypothetical protein